MINLIRLDDELDNGGKMTSASATMKSKVAAWPARATKLSAMCIPLSCPK